MDEQMIERLKIAFWASLTNANAGMRWLDHDSMDEMISAAWIGFEDAAHSVIAGKVAELTDLLREARHRMYDEHRVSKLIDAALAPYPERHHE